jgi:hypothetical protein
MNQLLIMIALFAALAFGNATRSGFDPARDSHSGDTISVDQTSKTETPQDKAGGGEGGWPGF